MNVTVQQAQYEVLLDMVEELSNIILETNSTSPKGIGLQDLDYANTCLDFAHQLVIGNLNPRGYSTYDSLLEADGIIVQFINAINSNDRTRINAALARASKYMENNP